jgi:hypothetical protein
MRGRVNGKLHSILLIDESQFAPGRIRLYQRHRTRSGAYYPLARRIRSQWRLEENAMIMVIDVLKERRLHSQPFEATEPPNFLKIQRKLEMIRN